MKYSKFIKEVFQPHWIILYLYIGLILVFAVWYFFNRESFYKLDTFIDSIYFSIVTITTLGYGDMLPCTNLGKIAVSLEAIAGVISLGFFLIRISLYAVEKNERKRVDTLKLSFKEQYKIWRENTVSSLFALTNNTEDIDVEKLYELDEFIKYYQKDDNKHWYEVANNLSGNDYTSTFYRKELLHEIEFLQRNIETFIMQVPIENIDSISVLNRYVNGLYRLRKHNLSENDEYRSFIRRLWALITSYDSNTREYDKNYLLNAIEAI